MGMKASDTAILSFEDVLVPLANTVGQEGQGFRYQMLQFQVRDRVSVHGFSLPDAIFYSNTIAIDMYICTLHSIDV